MKCKFPLVAGFVGLMCGGMMPSSSAKAEPRAEEGKKVEIYNGVQFHGTASVRTAPERKPDEKKKIEIYGGVSLRRTLQYSENRTTKEF